LSHTKSLLLYTLYYLKASINIIIIGQGKCLLIADTEWGLYSRAVGVEKKE
jgi:hypothetical protein